MAEKKVEKYYRELKEKNLARGYYLNPDKEFTTSLLKSLIINNGRYGYESCPCRLASGNKKDDLDIICPCNYRDSDVVEHGFCYCGLYVSKNIFDSLGDIMPIQERRPNISERKKMLEKNYPIWRCSVCGYICARAEAPDVCPICGVSHERFSKTKITTS